MPRSIEALPDGVLALIARQLSFKALCVASTLSNRWHGVVRTELFAQLDLTDRGADDIQALYDAGFTAHFGKPPVLSVTHIRKLSCRFMEDFLDEEELAARESISHKLIQSLAGVSTLKLELFLVKEPTTVFDDTLLPAITAFLDLVRTKIDSIELHIEIEACEDESIAVVDEQEGSSEGFCDVAGKLSAISEAVRREMLRSIHLVAVEIPSLPPAFANLLTSRSLRQMSLEDCADAFSRLPPVTSLSKVAISWTRREYCSLLGAYRICIHSADTLRSLRLESCMREDETSMTGTLQPRLIISQQEALATVVGNIQLGEPSILPKRYQVGTQLPMIVRRIIPVLSQLSHLQVGRNHFGLRSVLDGFLSCTQLPHIEKLTLETDDILEFDLDLAEKVSHLKSLRKIVFLEAPAHHVSILKSATVNAQRLVDLCSDRALVIDCEISPTCATPGDLALVFERMKLLSSLLVKVTLNLQPVALFRVQRLPMLCLPRVERLQITTCDMRGGSQNRGHSTGTSTATVGELLKRIQAPNMSTLRANFHLADIQARDNLESLKRVIADNWHPRLDCLEGTSTLSRTGVSGEELEVCRDALMRLCEDRDVDVSGLNLHMTVKPLSELSEEGDESISLDGQENVEAEATQENLPEHDHSSESSDDWEEVHSQPDEQAEANDDDSDLESIRDSYSNASTDSEDSGMSSR